MIRPSRIRTIRSAASATSASWVTSMIGLAAGVQAAEQLDDLGAALGVECAGRLVGEQQGRLVGQRPGDGQPLPLAAGEHAGDGSRLVADAEQVEQVTGPGLGHPSLAARR